MTTTAKRQRQVTVSGGLGVFAKFSGGEVTRAAAKNWNGGARKAELTYGRVEIGDITVGRPFSPTRDRPIIRRLRATVGVEQFTVTVQDLDNLDQTVGEPDVYTGCIVTSLPTPDYDETASEGAEFTITFMVEDVTPNT